VIDHHGDSLNSVQRKKLSGSDSHLSQISINDAPGIDAVVQPNEGLARQDDERVLQWELGSRDKNIRFLTQDFPTEHLRHCERRLARNRCIDVAIDDALIELRGSVANDFDPDLGMRSCQTAQYDRHQARQGSLHSAQTKVSPKFTACGDRP
jgi:hypothetical protein